MDDTKYEERKLWIGNLDPRVTEYQLLKLVQTHGPIEKFDLIFHRAGPLIGLPRGYAFVTYKRSTDARMALNRLHDRLLGNKKLNVKWAHCAHADNDEDAATRALPNIPALAMAKDKNTTDRSKQIQAIEAKLKLMQQKNDDELQINESVASKPPMIQQYQFNNKEKKTKVFMKKPYVRNKQR